eukprot:scaffold7504_cov121-Isochrysis_galbana.AAC.13
MVAGGAGQPAGPWQSSARLSACAHTAKQRAGGLDTVDGAWTRKRRRGGDVKACRLSVSFHLRSRDWVGADVDEQRLDEGCLAEELVAHHQLEGRVEGSAGDEETAQQQGKEGVGCGEEAGRGGGSARDADGVEGGR